MNFQQAFFDELEKIAVSTSGAVSSALSKVISPVKSPTASRRIRNLAALNIRKVPGSKWLVRKLPKPRRLTLSDQADIGKTITERLKSGDYGTFTGMFD